MNQSKKNRKIELKRLKASFKNIESKKKINFDRCITCKNDIAGKNFQLVYKKNHELKGKCCLNCS